MAASKVPSGQRQFRERAARACATCGGQGGVVGGGRRALVEYPFVVHLARYRWGVGRGRRGVMHVVAGDGARRVRRRC